MFDHKAALTHIIYPVRGKKKSKILLEKPNEQSWRISVSHFRWFCTLAGIIRVFNFIRSYETVHSMTKRTLAVEWDKEWRGG